MDKEKLIENSTTILMGAIEKIEDVEKQVNNVFTLFNRAIVNLQRLAPVKAYYDSIYPPDFKWDTCCNGRDCACMGMPIDPEWHIQQLLNKIVAETEEIAKEMGIKP